ncbi:MULTISPECIES: AtpZ/AtpI family protein [Paenibacillus]|uniref:AtpZ/AtpI family protein n=1 Tax=Paenibacillus lutrae TaxID=2078573 RepID=A0A7X3K0T3_9BACL|nr:MULTISPECIES: AtpZ/AtpI family protein [Paenibacillus]MVP01493.1 hypothetical protein [Paenibacillus lutrae]
MNNKGNRDNPWKAAGMVGAIGIDIAFCMIAGYAIATYLVNRFGGSKAWIAGGLMIGLFVGIVSVVMLLKKFLEESDE